MANEQMIDAFGETKSISAWHHDRRCTVSYKTLYARLADLDWTPEAAIATPRLRMAAQYRTYSGTAESVARTCWTTDLDPGF